MLRHLILLFTLLLCAAAVKAPVSRQPPEKKSRICYFANPKTALGENQARPANSLTTGPCHGGHTELSSLAANLATGDEFEGAPHELALILARHEGIFLNSTADLSEWEGSYICDHHLAELSRRWSQLGHRHVVWRKGKKTCGHFEHVHHTVHSHSALALTYDQSERALQEQGVLMHAGLPLCKQHHEALSTSAKIIPAVKDEPSPDDVEDVCYVDDKQSVQELLDKSFTFAQLADDAKDVELVKKIKEYQHEYELDVERILDLKAHHVRAVMAGKQRDDIIAGLKKNQAFITLDYAQKMLPAYYRESQKLYFGKAGLSWHISHVLANVGGKRAQHSFVHLLKNDQTSTEVVEVIRHVLTELKKMGIEGVHLRSDNAGYYHSSAALASIPDIMDNTKVPVLSWSFSESQAGKSSSDRIAALVKRKIRDYIGKRNNVETVEDMFKAITQGTLLKGLSVHLGTVKLEKPSPTKMERISELGTFSFAGGRIQAWRYAGLGQGIEFKNLHPVEAKFESKLNGGKTATVVKKDKEGKPVMDKGGKPVMVDVKDDDLLAISKGEEPFFWYVAPEKTYDKMHEINDVDDDVVSEQPSQNPVTAHAEAVYYCPTCGASFIKHSNLVRHIDNMEGKDHKVRPDRVTLLDYALGLFKDVLEDIQKAVKLTPFPDTIRALQTQAGTDEELKKGWALRTTKKGGRYPERSKAFVKQRFDEAMAQRRKLRGEDVELLLKAENSIAPEERMTLDQIKNYIRTLANPPKKTTRKTRHSRSVPTYTDDDGFIEEEVDVPEEDHQYTDDDIYMHVSDRAEYYFNEHTNPDETTVDSGHDFEEYKK